MCVMRKRIHTFLYDNHVGVAIASTLLCCAMAYLVAFFLRFDFGKVPADHRQAMWLGLPVLLLIRMIVLALFHVHRGLYRYFSVHDFMQLFNAVTLGSFVFGVVWTFFFMNRYFMPRSIYVLEWLLCLAFLVGVRVAVRLWRRRKERVSKMAEGCGAGRALIVGAGNLGENVLRMIDRHFLGNHYDVVGFVDNDSRKINSHIHGVPVLTSISKVPDIVKSQHVDMVVFAISHPEPGLFEEVVASCDGLEVLFNVVSLLRDIETGEVRVDRLRSMRIEDLLGRRPVCLDKAPVKAAVEGKTVLITGAGGSIGSELCRQVAMMNPCRLVLFEQGETPLFDIDRELRQSFPHLDIRPFIGDIKHAEVVKRAFREYRPDFVYHAAAYKHVPLMEAHPDEAVLNNVRGTRNLAEAAKKYGCTRFVMISTDKAVRPTNVMGATKRMCELVIQNMTGSGETVFSAVRFGNVLGSNGSVIPIFQKQLEDGGPLTITHPDMTRYFMMIPEAVSLVLQCGTMARAGDVFVLDMGQPVKIIELARNMIRLAGLKEGVDVSIEVSGLRPGEKMNEELVAYGEELQSTHIPKVNVLKQNSSRLAGDVVSATILHLEQVAFQRRVEKTRELLWRLIDLDYQRAQVGVKGLEERSMGSLLAEWNSLLVSEERIEDPPLKGRLLAILGVMDDSDILCRVVRAAGYELVCLSSFSQALHILMSDSSYCAVLCDCVTPSGSAWQFRERMRAMQLPLPVLSMSVYDQSYLVALLDVSPDLPLLGKPFTSGELISLLRSVVPSEDLILQ